MSDDPQDRPTRQADAQHPAERGQEQQATVLAAGASRTTFELMACVWMAHEATLEAHNADNDAATRIAFQQREREWWSRAYALLLALQDQAPSIVERLEGLGFDIDQREAPPEAPGAA